MSANAAACVSASRRGAAAALLERKPLIRLFEVLDRPGEETRIVGGAIRNALLGRPVHEIDLAATAEPEAVMARARAAGLRCIPTGLAHGTVTLICDGESFEVTSLREDVETDGRRAKVRFGRSFRADALRRDFTVNALFMARSGEIFDYVGGLADLEARRVRFIGDPTERIREDYLRILRFFRFFADFGEDPMDRDGFAACLREREGLARLSRERVRTEVFKLLCARRGALVAGDMCEAGLLGPLLASAPNPARLRALPPQPAQDPLLALAALCLAVSEDAGRLRERLRLSNAEFQRLADAASVLVNLHGCDEAPDAAELRVLLFRHGRQAALDGLDLAQAQARLKESWPAARQFLRATPELRLPFAGADLMARGFSSGPAIGAALAELRERWVESGFTDAETTLAGMLDEVAGTLAGEDEHERGL